MVITLALGGLGLAALIVMQQMQISALQKDVSALFHRLSNSEGGE